MVKPVRKTANKRAGERKVPSGALAQASSADSRVLVTSGAGITSSGSGSAPSLTLSGARETRRANDRGRAKLVMRVVGCTCKPHPTASHEIQSRPPLDNIFKVKLPD